MCDRPEKKKSCVVYSQTCTLGSSLFFPATTTGALTCLPCHHLMMSFGRLQPQWHAWPRDGRCLNSQSRTYTRSYENMNTHHTGEQTARQSGPQALCGHTGCRSRNKYLLLYMKHMHTHAYQLVKPQGCPCIKLRPGQPHCPWQHSLF